jgi:DNA replication licensing factor MCM5
MKAFHFPSSVIDQPKLGKNQLTSSGNQSKDCPKDPYQVLPDFSEFVDFQILKIQECPDAIPTGEVPRTYQLICERDLVDKLVPGTRVTITGVYTIMERKSTFDRNVVGLKLPYIICYSYSTEASGSRRLAPNFTAADKERFENMGKKSDIYKMVTDSIGEAIFGHHNIKKALGCMLFGGSAKLLPDKSRLRGDINILLLGDPSTAKSQFLKFIQKVAPIAVYTSGKGSSAAGLTAAIIKDPNSGEFQLEGGALVLADGGVVCIDEFDKMRPQDRVAIHEAMEQQTISIAKAGITTILNSRASVLAAANPVFGRYDDLKKVSDQIDLQTTILSRFDCIFIVRDERNEEADKKLAKHIMGLHARAQTAGDSGSRTNLNVEELKNYIMYAKMNVNPRLNEEAAVTIQNLYIEDRKKVRQQKQEKKSHIPVTVRQLEATIRLSESIAKMRLSKEVTRNDVEEAHKLFKVSTMQAIRGGAIPGQANASADLIIKIEESIKRRITVGNRAPLDKVLEELELKFNNVSAIQMAVNNLIRREELDSIQEGKVLLRKK